MLVHKEIKDNQLYLFINGNLIYKRWLNTGQSMVFDVMTYDKYTLASIKDTESKDTFGFANLTFALEDAHKHSSFNEHEIQNSLTCGCFYCLKVFIPNEVNEWIDENDSNTATALCPFCGIDSVLGSASGYPVDDKSFLKSMHERWF